MPLQAKRVTIVSVHNHGNLGGPMGSDSSTPLIAMAVCDCEASAIHWAMMWWRKAKARGRWVGTADFPEFKSRKALYEKLADIGSCGFVFRSYPLRSIYDREPSDSKWITKEDVGS